MVRTDDVGQCFGRGQWLSAGAFEIEIELRIRVTRFELFDELECQRGFADATHALQTGDCYATVLDGGKQLSLLIRTAGKVSGRLWHLVESGGCNRIRLTSIHALSLFNSRRICDRRRISSASADDRHYHRDDQRDRKHDPNPTAVRPYNRFEITRNQVTRNPADKKNRGHDSRDQPWWTRRVFQTVGTSKDELLGDAESRTVARESKPLLVERMNANYS